MIISEFDSFIWKFKKKKKTELVIKSEAGKAIVKLTAEVEITQEKPYVQSSRNGPACQRRCERRAAARAEDVSVAAEDAVATKATEATAAQADETIRKVIKEKLDEE